MNNTHINTAVYAQKVELLLRLMPIIMEEGVFAVHGGKPAHAPSMSPHYFKINLRSPIDLVI